jgi:hypothetical protein
MPSNWSTYLTFFTFVVKLKAGSRLRFAARTNFLAKAVGVVEVHAVTSLEDLLGESELAPVDPMHALSSRVESRQENYNFACSFVWV